MDEPAPADAASPHVVLVAHDGVTGTLRVLVERLVGVGIGVEAVLDMDSAAEHAARTPNNPPCVVLDLRELTSASPDEHRLAADAVKKLCATVPRCPPVVLTREAHAGLLVACLRAGAADLIDLQLEGTAEARKVVTRVWGQQRAKLADEVVLLTLRGMVEDLLKDLIKTERRSLDLEDKVSAYRRQTREMQPLSETRQPAIVIVEPDGALANDLARRLGAAGVDTFVFASGEDALHHVEASVPGVAMFDMALVTAQLPGIDGLETIARLRELHTSMPAFLVSTIEDGGLAAQAADLGVAGFVRKPVVDLDDIVARLAHVAKEALGRTREHSYLERIKTRHERVLARYRALPRGA